jgi:hypothetical protein
MGKAKFTSAEGCASNQSQAGKHIKQEICSVFISNGSLALTLMDGFEFTIFANGYLEKGACGGKGDLEAGRSRNFFPAIFIFKQAV